MQQDWNKMFAFAFPPIITTGQFKQGFSRKCGNNDTSETHMLYMLRSVVFPY